MASSKLKFRLCLLGFTLFLACVSVGLGAEGESLGSGTDADRRLSPRAEYTVCRLQCQVTGAEQQRKCQQLCDERLREREQREGSRGEDVEKDKRRDPEREREDQRRREHEREERRSREHEREHERGKGRFDENEKDPEREREERHREEHRREQEQERRRREQERREREHKGERDDEDEANQRDPDWRREKERKEQERSRREQEQERRERERRERERRGERDDEDEENKREPDWRREQERKEQERSRREQEQRERERRERERRGERDDEDEENKREPDWRREQEHKEQERRRKEREQKEREWEREHGRRGDRDENQKGRQSHQPYYFQEHQFQSRFKSGDGHWKVLERFSKRSELFKGLKNQRLAILEARPQTFIIPHHFDAECVLLVVKGKATITSVFQEKKETKKESYNVERGDVMTIPAGTTFYLANHENEDLQIVKLIQPVNNPGEFKDYVSAGGEAQSYYSVFSNDVLEAALNIPRDRLEKIFKQKEERRGKIIKASQEQLRALSQRATSVRKGSRGTRSPIKLESQTPVYRNQYGQMFEAYPNEFPQLQRTNVAAALVDIKQGGMMVPHFNSRATWIVFVSEGAGSFEMACPHVQGSQSQRGRREEERQWGRKQEEEQEERSSDDQIERVSGRLSQGGVLVIPAGHPIAIMASPNENLRLVGFGINAENNQRNFLAGKENIMNEVDREAKELAFNVEGKEAEEIFKTQKESFFTKGPEEGHRRSTERSPLKSIL